MKFKKLTSYLLMLCLVLNLVVLFPTIASAAATSGTCGDNLTWTLDSNGLLTISGTGAMKDYYNQSDYGSPWGGYNEDINSKVKSIKINSGITHIGDFAFFSCSNVEEIILPETVSSIGKFAFWCCSSLKEITLTNTISSIEYNAFSECSSLEEISIPLQITSLESGTFRGCDSLSIIRIGKNVSNIDCDAFGSISGIKGFAVDGNNNYFSTDANGVLYNKNKTKLIKYTTGSTANEYNIPNTVNQIEKYAFANARNIKTLTIPNGVSEIVNIFSGSENLSLSSINIPKSVTKISENLSECEGLQIHYQGTEEEWNAIYKNLSTHDITYYFFEDEASTIAYTLSDGVLTLRGTGAMKNYSAEESPWYSARDTITDVVIETGITSIGEKSFRYCSNLKTVSIPNSVVSIEKDAFRGCINLKNIDIPNSVKNIGENAFRDCEQLSTVIIPNSVETIESGAFRACKDMESITISNSIKCIGKYAFAECENISSVDITNGTTTIDIGAFYNCHNLSDISIPNTISKIGNDAFEGCTQLSTVNYADAKSKWYSIDFGRNNEYLLNATINYALEDTDENSIQISGVSLSETLVQASVKNIPENSWVFAATYSDSGSLLGLTTLTVSGTTASGIVAGNDFAVIKVFAWDNFENLIPIANTKNVSLVRN